MWLAVQSIQLLRVWMGQRSLCSWSLHSTCLSGDEMRNFGRAYSMKSRNHILQNAIGIGDALMLAKVLHPGVCQEEEPSSFLGILEYTPSVGPVAAALARQFFERREKRVAIARAKRRFVRG